MLSKDSSRESLSSLLLRGSLRLASGTLLANGIILLGAPALTRLYSQADFGTYGVLAATSSIVAVALFLRYETYIPAATERELRFRLPGALALIAVAVGICALPLLYVFFSLGPAIALSVVEATILCALGAVSYATFNVLCISAARFSQLHTINRGRIYRNALAIALQILMAHQKSGLFLGDVIARIGAAFYLLGSLPLRLRLTKRYISWLLRKKKNYAIFSAPAALLNATAANAYAPVLTFLFGVSATGEVFLIHRIVAVPISLLGQTLAVAYLGSVSESIRMKDYAGVRSAITKAGLLLSPLVISGFVAIFFILSGLGEIVFGPGWDDLALIFLLLSPGFALQVVVSPFSQSLNVFGFQKWQLAWDACRLLLVFGALSIPFLIWGSSEECLFITLAAYSAVMATMYLVQYLFFLTRLVSLSHASST